MFAPVLVATLAQRRPNAPNAGIAGPTLTQLHKYKYNGLIITVIRYVYQHNTLLNCILKLLLLLLQVNSLQHDH